MRKAFLCAALLFSVPAAAADWVFQRPPSSAAADFVLEADMSLDGEDEPHFVYHDKGTGLFHARRTAGGWTSSLIAASDVAFSHYPSIAVDSGGRAHVAYHDEDAKSLVHASWDGAAWVKTTVHAPAGGLAGEGTSLALRGDDPRIAYRLDPDGGLVFSLAFAEWNGSAWVLSTVDDLTDVGENISLALEADGTPHVSYYDDANGRLRYARWNGASWSAETVDDAGDVGQVSSLALDAAGRPRIAYLDLDQEALKYARWTGSAWVVETASLPGERAVNGCSLSLTSDGRPRILYAAVDGVDRILRQADGIGGGWFSRDVFKDANVFGYTSLSLAHDSTGKPHAGYIHLSPADLWHAASTLVAEAAVGPATGAALSFPLAGGASCGGAFAPPGVFREDAVLEIRKEASAPAAPSLGPVLEPAGPAFRASTVPPLQPSGKVTFSLCGDALASGDPDKALLARYDGDAKRWVPLETSRAGGGIEAWTGHLSLFQAMRPAEASAFEKVRIYPNPLSRSSGGRMTFAGFPAGTELSFYGASMRRVRVLRADGFGTAFWDGRDEDGRPAADGVYFVFAREGGRRASFKVLVRR